MRSVVKATNLQTGTGLLEHSSPAVRSPVLMITICSLSLSPSSTTTYVTKVRD